ncbi:hypothetical protein Fcan01_22060 [Folsomia candida]|uniref:Uncharacterized protein n=1 Tax=Folsomia candida TaxID=158441 RepID=A0A226DCJ7_FOLCA|nr:hypothetical protein Fcan01_22060 [Folsomia candida]
MACISTVTTHLGLNCISLLNSACGTLIRKRRTDVDRYFVNVHSCKICFSIGYDFMTPLVSTMMLIGFMTGVILSFISLKMYGIIPTVVYLYCPSLLTVLYVLISILLNMVINVYEDGRVLYVKWLWVLARSGDKAYVGRKLRAIQIPRIYGGLMGFNLYQCTAQTKTVYYEAILSYTITALMSINLGN